MVKLLLSGRINQTSSGGAWGLDSDGLVIQKQQWFYSQHSGLGNQAEGHQDKIIIQDWGWAVLGRVKGDSELGREGACRMLT